VAVKAAVPDHGFELADGWVVVIAQKPIGLGGVGFEDEATGDSSGVTAVASGKYIAGSIRRNGVTRG
jgi:hypothetical protein